MKIKILIIVFVLGTGQLFAQVAPQRPQLQIQGYAAADYSKSQPDGLAPDGTFGNPLLGILFSGQISQRVRFMSEASYYSDNALDLNQAWAGVNMSRYLDLRLGLYLVPFGYYNERNLPHEQLYINFPLNIAYLIPLTWRDIGLAAGGQALGLEYTAWFGNGLGDGEFPYSGQMFKDNNANKGWGGRLLWTPDPRFGVAYSYYNGKYDDANSRYRTMQSAHGYWITEDFEIVYEYTHSKTENPDGYARGSGYGYYGHLAFIWRTFRPFASYQKLDYSDPLRGPGYGGADMPGDGIAVNRTRWAVGAVLNLAQNVFFKFEYDFNREKDFEIKDDMWTFQIALSY